MGFPMTFTAGERRRLSGDQAVSGLETSLRQTLFGEELVQSFQEAWVSCRPAPLGPIPFALYAPVRILEAEFVILE